MRSGVLLATVAGMGALTFGSRALFLLRRTPHVRGWLGRFLDAFPLALFIALAVAGTVAPEGELVAGPGIAALAAGAFAVWRRWPVWAVMALGYAAGTAARLAT